MSGWLGVKARELISHADAATRNWQTREMQLFRWTASHYGWRPRPLCCGALGDGRYHSRPLLWQIGTCFTKRAGLPLPRLSVFPPQKRTNTLNVGLSHFINWKKNRNSDIFVQRKKARLTRVDGIVGRQTEGFKRVFRWRRGRDVLSSCHFTEWLFLWPQTTFRMNGNCGDVKCSRLRLGFLVCPALECSLWVGLLLTSTATSQ